MMTPALWTSLATIAGVWMITVLSPGPNLFATVHTATTQSRRLGVMFSAGIGVGTAIWATASLLGLGMLFATTTWLYQAVKLVGGGYLVYLGVKTLLSAGGSPSGPRIPMPVVAAGTVFRRGIVIDLSNPKAAVFFTSLFAVAVPPDAPLWFQGLVIAIVMAMAGGWYALVACLANIHPVAQRLHGARKVMTYLAGGLFVVIGARIASDVE